MAFELLTLVTDYGPGSDFVGSLHAVAYRIAGGGLRVIDLDHRVPPGDVKLGALRLERLMRYVPGGVHVGIVDPGVGTARLAVALYAGDRVFVGPDNGLLIWAAEACGGIVAATALDNSRYHLDLGATTFDGRDIFVPAAAHIAAGVAPGEIGTPVDPASLVRLERPAAVVGDDGGRPCAAAEVTQVDTFGNVQLGADAETARQLSLEPGMRVAVLAAAGAASVATFGSSFSDVAEGELVLLLDSDGSLALSVNRGRADTRLGIKPWERLSIRPG